MGAISETRVPIIRAPAPLGTVPTEWRIFKMGVNTTADGKTFTLTKESASEAIALWRAEDTELFFDFDHKSLDPKMTLADDPARAKAWFELKLEDDGLYVTNVRYKPEVAALVKSGDIKYYSPGFKAQNDVVNRIINMAFVNLPRLTGLTPLVANNPISEAIHAQFTDAPPLVSDALQPEKYSATLEVAETITAKESNLADMTMGEHAKAMKDMLSDHAACMKEHLAGMKDILQKHADANKPKPDGDSDEEKAKAKKAKESELEEQAKKGAKETCKGLIAGASGVKITPAEATDLTGKMESGALSTEYITGLLAAKQPLALSTTTETVVTPPVALTISAKAVEIAKSAGLDEAKVNAQWEANVAAAAETAKIREPKLVPEIYRVGR